MGPVGTDQDPRSRVGSARPSAEVGVDQSSEEKLVTLLQGVNARKPTAPSENSAAERELQKGDPDFKKPVTIQNLFTHHDTHPIVLNFALIKTFGLDWMGWQPETLWAEIHKNFKSQISELSRAKVQTLRTIATTEAPWEYWQVFEKVIQGLNNNIPNFEIMQAPTLEQLYAGVDMIEQLRTSDFSDEVRLYMAGAVLHEDVTYVPPPLDFIQVEVSRPHYHCKTCGNEDSALFFDGTCDVCSGKFKPEQGLSFQPIREYIDAGRGKDLSIILKHDPSEVEFRWNELKDKPAADVHLEENAVDIQVGKLLVARDYMNIRRRQLADQLTSLKSWLGAV